jgi:DNA/RNA-binding domain of Phe-tRNA-synthetase-like protein/ureidoglycolate hydrolase
MRPTVSTGDLALAAQPATRETFSAFGRVLETGQRAHLGKRGRVLITMEPRRRAPRRVTHLQRYPEAKRAYLPTLPVASWIVALAPGEPADAEPAAFLVPAGSGLVVNEGVWHAGPVPLEDATVCEMLETIGSTDRFDRKSLRELAEIEAVRVLLPEEPGGPATGLDLAAPNAVLIDASLHGRLRLGCLVVDDLALPTGEEAAALGRELQRAVEGLRAMWEHAGDLIEIPGINIGRHLYREVGIDATRFVPRSEALAASVLAGRDPKPAHPLAAIAALCMLRLRAPLALYDADEIHTPVVVRSGADAESYVDSARRRVVVEGRPVLADADGAFGSPIGDARRTAPGPSTRRVLAVFFLPPTADDATIRGLQDGVGRALEVHAGGTPSVRLTFG